MVKRKRIALNFRVGYDVSAGIVIYIQNLIKGFNLLEEDLKPHLIILYSPESPVNEIREIGYPYIEFYLYKPVPRTFLSRVVNKISRITLGKNLVRRYSFPRNIDILFPYFDCDETYSFHERIYWKPDFQEMYYPQYVSTVEYNYVVEFMKDIAIHKHYHLVLSSGAAFHDFKKFFSPYSNTVEVLRFVSFLPAITNVDESTVLKKYEITKPYFMVSNQFWPHKNHMLVLEAISKLKNENKNFQVVFSGKQSSYRDKEYFSRLQQFIEEQNIGDYVNFIGFVPRIDQIVMMKSAVSVIQPSLFEGWSTVIEDCKALNQFVIAGNLEVNQEQLTVNARFFDLASSDELSKIMREVLTIPVAKNTMDYSQNINQYKSDLIHVFKLNSHIK